MLDVSPLKVGEAKPSSPHQDQRPGREVSLRSSTLAKQGESPGTGQGKVGGMEKGATCRGSLVSTLPTGGRCYWQPGRQAAPGLGSTVCPCRGSVRHSAYLTGHALTANWVSPAPQSWTTRSKTTGSEGTVKSSFSP